MKSWRFYYFTVIIIQHHLYTYYQRYGSIQQSIRWNLSILPSIYRSLH